MLPSDVNMLNDLLVLYVNEVDLKFPNINMKANRLASIIKCYPDAISIVAKATPKDSETPSHVCQVLLGLQYRCRKDYTTLTTLSFCPLVYEHVSQPVSQLCISTLYLNSVY